MKKILLFSFIIIKIIQSLYGLPINCIQNDYINFKEPDDKLCNCDLQKGYCSNINSFQECSLINIESSYNITLKITPYNISNYEFRYSFNKYNINNDIMKIKILNNGKVLPKFHYYLKLYDNNLIIKNETYCQFDSDKFDSDNLELVESNCQKMSISLIFNNSSDLENLYLQLYFEQAPISIITTITTTPNTTPITPSHNNIGLIIGIIGGIVFLIGIIIIIICIKKYKGKKDINENNNIIINPENLKELINQKINKIKLDKLFKNELFSKIYNKNNIINNNYKCTICNEDFIENLSIVLTLKCGHTFHQICIKNWAYKNLICPKCPICNDFILGTNNQISLKDTLSDYNLSQTDNNNTISLFKI